ncbi:MAG: ATP-binding cassette domain-containing protein [Myxococcota bacterium]|nr:ATP-binding cassette domain-containing protein [Myxococcota bacterium]
MIRVTGLRKSFKQVRAVDEVSFEAGDGEITGLLGPNGAGKTTVLRILYGLLSADGGTAEIDGIDALTKRQEAQARIGALPDTLGLYKRLTAREHIHYYGELRGLGGKDLKARTNALIDKLDMNEIADRRVAGFSAGERMKVNIARALIHEPQNVLLDEPTNGLDIMSTRKMRGMLLALKEEGRCVLLSSHVMQEVSALCDRVVIISQGKVVASGTPDEIRESAGADNLEDAFVSLADGNREVAQ